MQTEQYDIQSTSHQVAGHVLRLHRRGLRTTSNRPLRVFMLHGMADTAQTWQGTIRAVPAEVWTFDLPWSGLHGTDWPHAMDAAAWWGAALAQCPVTPDVCVGHSFGASVLLDWLSQQPAAAAHLSGLVLISPHYLGTSKLAEWQDLNRFALDIPQQLAAALRVRMSPGSSHNTDLLASMVKVLERRILPDGLLEFFRLLLKSRTWDVGSWTFPVQVVAGECDSAEVRESAVALRDAIQHASLVRLPRCGHHPMQESPQELDRVLAAFLSVLESSAALGRELRPLHERGLHIASNSTSAAVQ